MSDSKELDDILNEIKNMGNKNNEEAPVSRPQPTKKEQDKAIKDFTAPPIRRANLENASDSSRKKADYKEDKPMKKDNSPKEKNKKPIIIAVIAVLVVAIIGGAIAFAMTRDKDEDKPTTTAPPATTVASTTAPAPIVNPLTGEDGYNKKAVNKRPIACVVENASQARPQWGIDDDKNPPDIIVEGEVEGGETRMLFMYADYTDVPSQIGPMRSARPPYIKFSELFDAIFLHWGQSQTKRGTPYIGANTVFREDNVDHINQMTYGGSVALFGRDKSRGVSMEHTGVMYGDKIAAAIKEEGFRTKADDKHYTKFSFNEEDSAVGADKCDALGLTFSSRTGTRDWTYSAEDKMYHTSDFRTDVERKNLLVIFDSTEYIAKSNYKNSGSAEIYCNYNLSGGKGKLASNGTVTDVTWKVKDGKLAVTDANGSEIKLNKGTTWIGYASSNNGGSVKTTPSADAQ